EEEMRSGGIAACLFKPIRQSDLFNALLNAVATEVPAMHQETTVDGEKEAPAPPDQKPVRPEVHALTDERPRLLLAEDNVVNQKVALRLLQKLGYSADVVTNGLEAVEAMERLSYPLVLMDCHLPELDGFR